MLTLGACGSTQQDDDATDDALNTDDTKLASLFSDKVDAPNLPSVRGYSLYRVRLTERTEKAFDKLLNRLPTCKPGSAVRDCWAYKTSVETHLHAIEDGVIPDERMDDEERERQTTVSVIADADRNIAAFAIHDPSGGFSDGLSTMEFGWLKGKEALFGDLVQLMRARAEAIHAWPVSVYFSGDEPMELEVVEDQEEATKAAIATLTGMGLKCAPREPNDWSSGGDCESRKSTPWYR